MKFFLKVILSLVLVVTTGVLVVSVIAGYNGSMSLLIRFLHEEIRADKILLLVSTNKFLLFQFILFFTLVVLVVLLIKFNTIWDFMQKSFSGFKEAFSQVFKDAGSTALSILILPVVSYIFFAFYLPVAYDEASTYVNFTSRSPLVSMLYYPAPNNHILHSVITNFTRYIPLLPPLQCMRISSIIASLMTCIVLFSFVRKYYSVNSALTVAGLSSVLFLYVYYSFASRGYALVNLFFVLCLYCVYKIIFENNQRRHWFYFSFFSVLGFYTMPSFLYPFFTLNLILLLVNFKGIFRQAISGIAIVIATAILYLPVVALNGLDALTNNKQLQSATRAEVLALFPKFASNSLAEITGINFLVIIPLLLVALLVLIIQKRNLEVKLVAAFILAPILLMWLHPVIPFARTFSYYSIVLPFLCILPVNPYLKKNSSKYVAAIVIIIQCIFLYSFYTKMKLHKSENMQYAEINKHIAGNYSYYLNCKWYDAVLSFELKTHNFKNSVVTYNNPQIKMSADTVNGYDYIIIDKVYDETKTMTPLYSDKITNVYKK
jgi:hypothetical protein